MRKTLVIMLAMVFVLASTTYASPNQGSDLGFSKNSTPPNEIGIAKLLMQQGILDENSTQEQIDKAVNDYMKQKMTSSIEKNIDKKILSEKIKENGSSKIKPNNMIQGNKNGKKDTNLNDIKDKNWKVKEQKWNGEVRQPRLLILLAEFSDDEYDNGPLHNQIERPGVENNTDLWVEDFSREHYKNMLFTEGGYDAIDQNGETLHLNSMVDYYMEMSGGSYKVDGDVYGWFTLPHSEAYYGDDSNSGHDNKLPGTAHSLVADLLVEAQGQVPFEDYDIEDTFDLDGDGNFDEPDGIIDHLVIVHAGVDQSGGGGVQGDNALWAHSSSVFELIPSDHPTSDNWGNNMLAYNYVMQGEDGTIGVFCHEFGHDIGLPDEYDTIYSGNGDTVGFYSLMASGSWVGKPLGTEPTPISPWGRMVLGQIWGGKWIQPIEVDLNSIKKNGKTFRLDQTASVGKNQQAIKVNLPQKRKDTIAPNQGEYEFFGGKGDDMNNMMVMSAPLDLSVAQSVYLDFSTWYNIEEAWDYGFVQVSADNGATWESISNENTSSVIDPQAKAEIAANLPGFTGSSDGWVNQSFDLSDYAGKNILIGFRYMTDAATSLDGFYVDEVKITADGNVIFADDAENGEAKWSIDGWSLSQGYEMKDHYYMLEWRSHNKTDAALQYCYNYINSLLGIAEYYDYEPGLLVWYRDMSYDDNWVGEHPGRGFLSVVDSHAEPIMVNNKAVRTRIQTHDAAFNIDSILDKILTLGGQLTQIGQTDPVTVFDDSKDYWYADAPHAGVKVPRYGLKVQVQRNSEDYSIGEIKIYK